MKKKLYIDIDGVLGDFVAAIFSYFYKAKLVNPFTYKISQMFNNVENRIIHHPQLYNRDNFKLYPFAQNVLRRAELLEYEIMFVSARPKNIHTQTVDTLLQLNLQNNFEIHDGLYPVKEKLVKIKDDIILNEITHAWIIEDSPIFIMEMAKFYMQYNFMKSIIKTLMYLQPYNQSEQSICDMLPEFQAVMNWKHIESEVFSDSNF